MVIFVKIIQLLLCLSILVIIHEFGHFIAAKIFKVRVEKFYLFFNPKFSLFKIKKINGKWKVAFLTKNTNSTRPKIDEYGRAVTNAKGKPVLENIPIDELKDNDWSKNPENTEVGIGWVPLGGYVKIAGMIDESMDTEQLKQPAQGYEFRSKPAWQRLIIMLGGIIMNIIAAMVIYIGLLFAYGETYLPNENVKYGITVDSLGYEIGLRNGDKIVSVDNKVIESFYKIPEAIILEQSKTIQVIRNNEITDVCVNPSIFGKLIKAKNLFISPRIPFIAGRFSEGSAAKAAGVEEKDKLIAINHERLEFFDEYSSALISHKNSNVIVSVVRQEDTMDFNVALGDDAMLGIYPSTENIIAFANKDYSLIKAIPAGCSKAFTGIGSYLKQLKLIFSPEVKGYESVGSFISIGSIFPGHWDWQSFWHLTAFISIVLAIMNVLPIPALDGGHVIFTLYEMVTRRKPSDKFLERAQMIGMMLLLALFVLATFNDITRFIIK